MYTQRELVIFQIMCGLRKMFGNKLEKLINIDFNDIERIARDTDKFYLLQKFYLSQRRLS